MSGNTKIRTNSLFTVHRFANDLEPLYTLKEQDEVIDGVTYPSLYRLYLEANDPYEREFANKYIPNGYTGWLKLTNANFFKEHIEKWRRELDVIIKAKALLRIREVAEVSEGPSGYQANKFLLEGSWNVLLKEEEEAPQVKTKRGRPASKTNKNEVLTKAQQMEEELVQEHFELLAKRPH